MPSDTHRCSWLYPTQRPTTNHIAQPELRFSSKASAQKSSTERYLFTAEAYLKYASGSLLAKSSRTFAATCCEVTIDWPSRRLRTSSATADARLATDLSEPRPLAATRTLSSRRSRLNATVRPSRLTRTEIPAPTLRGGGPYSDSNHKRKSSRPRKPDNFDVRPLKTTAKRMRATLATGLSPAITWSTNSPISVDVTGMLGVGRMRRTTRSTNTSVSLGLMAQTLAAFSKPRRSFVRENLSLGRSPRFKTTVS